MYWTYSWIREYDRAYVPYLGGSCADRNSGLRRVEIGSVVYILFASHYKAILIWKVIFTDSRCRLNIEERTCSQLEIESQCLN